MMRILNIIDDAADIVNVNDDDLSFLVADTTLHDSKDNNTN
jgi:hypothetical protein